MALYCLTIIQSGSNDILDCSPHILYPAIYHGLDLALHSQAQLDSSVVVSRPAGAAVQEKAEQQQEYEAPMDGACPQPYLQVILKHGLGKLTIY